MDYKKYPVPKEKCQVQWKNIAASWQVYSTRKGTVSWNFTPIFKTKVTNQGPDRHAEVVEYGF